MSINGYFGRRTDAAVAVGVRCIHKALLFTIHEGTLIQKLCIPGLLHNIPYPISLHISTDTPSAFPLFKPYITINNFYLREASAFT
jgi:hypothetical protein